MPLIILLIAGLNQAVAQYDQHKEIPLRFSDQRGSDSLSIDKDTGWVTYVPFLYQFRGYYKEGRVPFAFSVPAKLVFEYNSTNAWPGNWFACRAWIETADEPGMDEMTSDYGIEFGLETRNYWVNEAAMGLSKDFKLNITGNGGLPLGETFLGGMDYVDALSIPLDEFIPGSGQISKTVQAILKVADYTSLDMASISMGAENVIEGNYVEMQIGDEILHFTGYGQANAITFMLYIPVTGFDYTSNTHVFQPYIRYNYNLYRTIGMAFTLVNPFTFTLMPSVVNRLDSLLPGGYSPPATSLLHDGGFYQKTISGGSVLSDQNVAIAIKVNGRPNMPDMAVVDIIFNPTSRTDNVQRKLYADENSLICFTIVNIGERATVGTSDFQAYASVDGVEKWREYVSDYTWPDPVILQKNEQLKKAFAYRFSEGVHDIRISSGYIEISGYDGGGHPYFRAGDPNPYNNMINMRIVVQPPRGTVAGNVFTDGLTGIGGIPVRLTGPGYRETMISSTNPAQLGVYRFLNVPTGDYCLEFLPDATNSAGYPVYWPRSFWFHHESSDTDDFTGKSGMCMLKFQRLTGLVMDRRTETVVSNVLVQMGESQLTTTNTSASGVFSFNKVTPKGYFIFKLYHDQYETKTIGFSPDVVLTAQTNTPIQNFYDYAVSNLDSGGIIYLDPDETAPSLFVEPLSNQSFSGTNLVYRFRASDGDNKKPSTYRHRIYNAAGTVVLLTGSWQTYPYTNDPAVLVQASANISSIGVDGSYNLVVDVRDLAGNVTSSPLIPFIKDTVAPVVSQVSIAGGAPTVTGKTASVSITIGNTESGTLAAYISNDNAEWSEPFCFTGATCTVSDWQLIDEDVFHGSADVYVKVVDLAGHTSTTANASAQIDTTGDIVLADGSCYYNSTHVPLRMDIAPPDCVEIYRESVYAGTLDVGSSTSNRYRAQAFKLTQSNMCGRVKLFAPQAVGNPSPLHVRLVTGLSNSDPTSPGFTLAHWSATAEEVELLRDVYDCILVDFPVPQPLAAGTNYVLIYTESVSSSNYYTFYSGNSLFNNTSPRYDYSNSQWVVGSEVSPGMGIPTFVMTLYNNHPGEIRIAADGVCDTETWQLYTNSYGISRYADFPGTGARTVCVQYRHPTDHSKDGYYYDSVVIDNVPPAGTAQIYMVDRGNNAVTLDLSATDNVSGVRYVKWMIDGYAFNTVSYQSRITVNYPAPFDGINVWFVDEAGNESVTSRVTSAEDLFPPSVALSIMNGAAFTSDELVSLVFSVWDDQRAEIIHCREIRTGEEYSDLPANTEKAKVALPSVTVDVDGEPVRMLVDGRYKFAAWVDDSAGNASTTSCAEITLDRVAPEIRNFYLTSEDGEPVTTTTNILMHLDVYDLIGPLDMRYRIGSGAWSDWMFIANEKSVWPIAGTSLLPSAYTVYVEVQDGPKFTDSASAEIKLNHKPATPSGVSPDGSTGGNAPLLAPSVFSDPDSDSFGSAQFRMGFAGSGTNFYDSGQFVSNQWFQVPTGMLSYDVTYEWKVRYMDAYGLWSEWSAPVSFTPKTDTDGDGIPDYIETATGTNPNDNDTDDDGLNDGVEDADRDGQFDSGETNPRNPDTDGDSMTDGFEASHGFNPLGGDSAIRGVVSYSGSQTGRVVVSVYTEAWPKEKRVAYTEITAPGAYEIGGLFSNTYYVSAVMVTTPPYAIIKVTDPSGTYGPFTNPTPILVHLTQTVSSVSFALFDGSASNRNQFANSVLCDFDGDGESDIGCYDAEGHLGQPPGSWYFMRSQAGFDGSKVFGYAGTVPVTGDFDGDGTADYGCYDAAGNLGQPAGSWYLMQSSAGFETRTFGYAGTVPVTGDFDGDGTADYGCYDAAGNLGQPAGSWYLMQSTAGFETRTFGYAGTVPVVGDFDGDGTADYGCYDAAGNYGQPAGSWYLMQSTAGFTTATFGYAGTVPIAGDFDGDGAADYGCYDAAGNYGQPAGSWYLMQSSAGFETRTFGYAGTVPVTGDFDGDGTADYGCYDAAGNLGQPAGSWYMMQSSEGFKTETFGYAGTVPFGM